jgi:hypothetical protein
MEQLMFPDGDRKSNSVSACAVAARPIVVAAAAIHTPATAVFTAIICVFLLLLVAAVVAGHIKDAADALPDSWRFLGSPHHHVAKQSLVIGTTPN